MGVSEYAAFAGRPFGSASDRFGSGLALQRQLGLLPDRWRRPDFDNSADPVFPWKIVDRSISIGVEWNTQRDSEAAERANSSRRPSFRI